MFQKIRPLYFLFLLFVLFSCKSEADKIAEQTTTRNALIDSTINSFQKKLLTQQIDSVFSKYNFNGSVAVIKNDEILYQKENGFEDFKQKKKLDSSSVFAIASVSKQFTAVLVLLLEDEGKLNTEDKVSKYLTDFQTSPFKNITIKELLNHTSGISDFGNGLVSEPGKAFNYSNKGFMLLGEIVEKVSGKSYDENVKELFEKAG
ncbi:MAG: beta-lactamase family protein, partial [Flavobacteriales bacterium]|nr:beta-lactamase family protein [Flavobacteriales bacterium]